MEIALRLLGIGQGDEVITTPLTWVATSNVILEVGARPVFVDIDANTRNIDLNKIEAAITAKTRAIIPVDLAGLPVDRARLYEIANRRKIRVIEDAAQSFGSTFNGEKIGSFGDFVSFSFHPNKNITSIEGGCLVLNSEAEAKLAEQYRLQGVIRSGNDGMDVELVGGKFNLTDVAARVGLGQLPRIDEFNQKRILLVKYYLELLSQPEIKAYGLGLPLANFTDSNWHMFQVLLPGDRMTIKRSEVMAKLTQAGIGSGVHYPVIHLFSLYRNLGWKEGDFPIAENVGRNLLTLPLFPSMTHADVERVVKELIAIVSAHIRS
jgi:dTDP-4-amino-4,6-dideoxygalactose transaminase